MVTYDMLAAGATISVSKRRLTIRAIEPCGLITDIQFYDENPDAWHTFASKDAVAFV